MILTKTIKVIFFLSKIELSKKRNALIDQIIVWSNTNEMNHNNLSAKRLR